LGMLRGVFAGIRNTHTTNGLLCLLQNLLGPLTKSQDCTVIPSGILI
jgi:hypothetical protein